MLKNVPAVISPELLKIICEMGHGDELVIGDANFPAVTCAKRLVRADGISGTQLLDAIMQLFPLDKAAKKNCFVMAVGEGEPTPTIWAEYNDIIDKHDDARSLQEVERFAFYEQAKNAFAVIQTGEKALYANIILKKGTL